MGASAARKEARKRKFGNTFEAENGDNRQVDKSKESPDQVDKSESIEKVKVTDGGMNQNTSDGKISRESIPDIPSQATEKRAKTTRKARQKFILFINEFTACAKTPLQGVRGLGLATHTYCR